MKITEMEQMKSTKWLNPNHHGPLKLLNCHGIDGKSWFKKEEPLWALGRDYKVVWRLTYWPHDCPSRNDYISHTVDTKSCYIQWVMNITYTILGTTEPLHSSPPRWAVGRQHIWSKKTGGGGEIRQEISWMIKKKKCLVVDVLGCGEETVVKKVEVVIC